MPANWKTTALGLITVLLPIILQYLGANVPPAVHAGTVPAGLGLILAQDATKPAA